MIFLGHGMNCEYVVLKRFQHIVCFGFGMGKGRSRNCLVRKKYVDFSGIGQSLILIKRREI